VLNKTRRSYLAITAKRRQRLTFAVTVTMKYSSQRTATAAALALCCIVAAPTTEAQSLRLKLAGNDRHIQRCDAAFSSCRKSRCQQLLKHWHRRLNRWVILSARNADVHVCFLNALRSRPVDNNLLWFLL